jgi:hypothetical protein
MVLGWRRVPAAPLDSNESHPNEPRPPGVRPAGHPCSTGSPQSTPAEMATVLLLAQDLAAIPAEVRRQPWRLAHEVALETRCDLNKSEPYDNDTSHNSPGFQEAVPSILDPSAEMVPV